MSKRPTFYVEIRRVTEDRHCVIGPDGELVRCFGERDELEARTYAQQLTDAYGKGALSREDALKAPLE